MLYENVRFHVFEFAIINRFIENLKKKTQRSVFQIRQFQFKLTLYQIIVNAIIFEKQNARVYFHRFKYN